MPRERPTTAAMRKKIMDSIWGYSEAQTVLSANAVGLFPALLEGPRTALGLARKLHCDARGIRILGDALTAMGLLRRRGERLALEPAARPLFDPASPTYLGYALQHQKNLYDRWGHLDEVVRSGQPKRRRRQTQREQDRFLMAMIGGSQPSVMTFLTLIDLKRDRAFLDLGGGFGHYALAVKERWPHLRCALFDLPMAIRRARRYLAQLDLGDQIHTLEGDVRTDDLRGPYDVILISNVLHMFSRADGVRTLKQARRALTPRGRIYLKDFYLRDDRKGPLRAAQFALNMLVNTEAGGVFTEQDYRHMIARAGLKRTRVHRVGEASCVQVLRVAPPRKATLSSAALREVRSG